MEWNCSYCLCSSPPEWEICHRCRKPRTYPSRGSLALRHSELGIVNRESFMDDVRLLYESSGKNESDSDTHPSKLIDVVPSELRAWPCPVCTFLNRGAAGACEICDTARPDFDEEVRKGLDTFAMKHLSKLILSDWDYRKKIRPQSLKLDDVRLNTHYLSKPLPDHPSLRLTPVTAVQTFKSDPNVMAGQMRWNMHTVLFHLIHHHIEASKEDLSRIVKEEVHQKAEEEGVEGEEPPSEGEEGKPHDSFDHLTPRDRLFLDSVVGCLKTLSSAFQRCSPDQLFVLSEAFSSQSVIGEVTAENVALAKLLCQLILSHLTVNDHISCEINIHTEEDDEQQEEQPPPQLPVQPGMPKAVKSGVTPGGPLWEFNYIPPPPPGIGMGSDDDGDGMDTKMGVADGEPAEEEVVAASASASAAAASAPRKKELRECDIRVISAPSIEFDRLRLPYPGMTARLDDPRLRISQLMSVVRHCGQGISRDLRCVHLLCDVPMQQLRLQRKRLQITLRLVEKETEKKEESKEEETVLKTDDDDDDDGGADPERKMRKQQLEACEQALNQNDRLMVVSLIRLIFNRCVDGIDDESVGPSSSDGSVKVLVALMHSLSVTDVKPLHLARALSESVMILTRQMQEHYAKNKSHMTRVSALVMKVLVPWIDCYWKSDFISNPLMIAWLDEFRSFLTGIAKLEYVGGLFDSGFKAASMYRICLEQINDVVALVKRRMEESLRMEEEEEKHAGLALSSLDKVHPPLPSSSATITVSSTVVSDSETLKKKSSPRLWNSLGKINYEWDTFLRYCSRNLNPRIYPESAPSFDDSSNNSEDEIKDFVLKEKDEEDDPGYNQIFELSERFEDLDDLAVVYGLTGIQCRMMSKLKPRHWIEYGCLKSELNPRLSEQVRKQGNLVIDGLMHTMEAVMAVSHGWRHLPALLFAVKESRIQRGPLDKLSLREIRLGHRKRVSGIEGRMLGDRSLMKCLNLSVLALKECHNYDLFFSMFADGLCNQRSLLKSLIASQIVDLKRNAHNAKLIWECALELDKSEKDGLSKEDDYYTETYGFHSPLSLKQKGNMDSLVYDRRRHMYVKKSVMHQRIQDEKKKKKLTLDMMMDDDDRNERSQLSYEYSIWRCFIEKFVPVSSAERLNCSFTASMNKSDSERKKQGRRKNRRRDEIMDRISMIRRLSADSDQSSTDSFFKDALQALGLSEDKSMNDLSLDCCIPPLKRVLSEMRKIIDEASMLRTFPDVLSVKQAVLLFDTLESNGFMGQSLSQSLFDMQGSMKGSVLGAKLSGFLNEQSWEIFLHKLLPILGDINELSSMTAEEYRNFIQNDCVVYSRYRSEIRR